MAELQQDLFDINYRLVRSRRKTVAIHVHRNGEVEVRAPRRAPEAMIRAFVQEKRHWIESKQAEWASLPGPHRLAYHEGATHYFLGEPHGLVFGAQADPDAATIPLNVRSTGKETVSRALDRWYRQEAEQVFSARHSHWRQEMHDFALPPSEIALRKMKSRWGSCSRRGKITLNTQLVRYPMACIDAVIVHELCHLLEFNHSRRFYNLMDQAYPQWRTVDKLLKDLALQY